MWRTGSLLLAAVVGMILVVPAAAQDGRWTLRLQAGGVRGSGESMSTRASGLAPSECTPFDKGLCWDVHRYGLEEDRPLAGLALGFRLTPQLGLDATVWRGSMRLRSESQGWPSSGVDYSDKREESLDDVGLSGADLGVVFHLPAQRQVDVYGGVVVGWLWPDDAYLHGSDREVKGGFEYGALAGADVALGGGAWRVGLQVRHTWNSLEVEEIDPLHPDWADLDARLTAVQLTLAYTF